MNHYELDEGLLHLCVLHQLEQLRLQDLPDVKQPDHVLRDAIETLEHVISIFFIFFFKYLFTDLIGIRRQCLGLFGNKD